MKAAPLVIGGAALAIVVAFAVQRVLTTVATYVARGYAVVIILFVLWLIYDAAVAARARRRRAKANRPCSHPACQRVRAGAASLERQRAGR